MNFLIEKIYAGSGTDGTGATGGISNPINIDTLGGFVNKILEIVIQVGLPILVVSVVYVGFLFVAARGSEDGLKKAKSAFLTVVIGAAIVLGAFVISEAIQVTVNNLR